MLKFLQIILVLFISIFIASALNIFYLWDDSVGITHAADNIKSNVSIFLFVTSIIGLFLVGDKAFLHEWVWRWIRNTLAQNKLTLSLANILLASAIAWLVFIWNNYRQVIFFSSQSVVLTNIEDIENPKEIGILEAGVERRVLVKIGKPKIGFRVIGTTNYRVVHDFDVPPRGSKSNKLVFITQKGTPNDPPLLQPDD